MCEFHAKASEFLARRRSAVILTHVKQELSYRKQIARQLHKH